MKWVGALGAAGGLYYAGSQGYFDSIFTKEPLVSEQSFLHRLLLRHKEVATLTASRKLLALQIPLPPKKEYDKVRGAIADVLENDDYDDGRVCLTLLLACVWGGT